MILTEDEAIELVENSQTTPEYITAGREMACELFALVQGDKFKEELIKRIEKIESTEKSIARKKYSRNVADFFERLLQPIGNIYSSTGGNKQYDITTDSIKKEVLTSLSNISGNQSLEKWLRQTWMPLYHTDPNGLIMYEYKGEEIYPTYKSINVIRDYKPKGQNVDWLLFEPYDLKINGTQYKAWRLIDDENDRTILQLGNNFKLSEEFTFQHPFGKVPAIVNSDIQKLGYDWRVSPIDKIVELCKEYARDQSIKTIYKFQNGFPIHWRYVSSCRSCAGTGKLGNGDICGNCDGKGHLTSSDVTDMVTMPIPDVDDPVLAPNIAGYITPDLDTWTQYNTELELLENYAYRTHWNVIASNDAEGQAETATGRFIDLQPQINKLNEYADTAEWVEWQMTEFLINFIDQNKNKAEALSFINYGRRFILESADTILEKYHTSKDNGDNDTIKDRLLNEYITAKYKNDPKHLRVELLKSVVEPYIHYDLEEITKTFGEKEAARKAMFNKWWTIEANKDSEAKTLIESYNKYFNTNYEVKENEEASSSEDRNEV